MSSMNSSKVIPFPVLYVLSKDVLETPSLWASLTDVSVSGSTSISSESLKIL